LSFGLSEIIHNNEYIGGPVFLDKTFGKSNTETLAVFESMNEDDWNWDAMMDLMFPLWNIYLESKKDRIIKRWLKYSAGKSVWVTAKYGEGKVVAFSTHPEFLDNQSPPRIIYNAVFYATSIGPVWINAN
jgi:hypothetical protein